VRVAVGGGGEVELHDGLELGLVAAVLEGRVVVVAAVHVGLVVREARAVEAEVVAPLVVGVGLAHAVVRREGCVAGGREGERERGRERERQRDIKRYLRKVLH